MTKKIVFRPAADAEFCESAEWYEAQRPGLGIQFIDHVQQALDKIAEDPLRNPAVLRDIREAVVGKFPFAIYYRVKPDRIVILAVFHCSRDPAIWQGRN
ncbi:MAG: type II toxin-antitoxin system RelE/ParE family toxin [Planctomycetes bacterium]|nr:type II toxin-antitoxin system RelE/ParE family toxin [Planctomycetota bacterium]